MGRSPCCSKVGLRRGPWSTEEDTLLTNYINQHGEGQWRSLPKKAGLLRCGKSCRLRWMNYLRPGIKRGNITPDEEDLITRLHSLLGNRWSLIAGRLPGRTDNEIKNHWNTHLHKKLQSAGIIHHHLLKDHHTAPKHRRSKKSKTAKKQQQQQQNTAQEEGQSPNPKTTVLYLPKPIRVSSAFSRSNSVDSLFSGSGGGSSSCSDPPCPPPPPPPPPVAVDVDWPLFELEEDANFEDSQDFDFFTTGFHYIMSSHSDSHVNTLEQVYDEYLQLL